MSRLPPARDLSNGDDGGAERSKRVYGMERNVRRDARVRPAGPAPMMATDGLGAAMLRNDKGAVFGRRGDVLKQLLLKPNFPRTLTPRQPVERGQMARCIMILKGKVRAGQADSRLRASFAYDYDALSHGWMSLVVDACHSVLMMSGIL